MRKKTHVFHGDGGGTSKGLPACNKFQIPRCSERKAHALKLQQGVPTKTYQPWKSHPGISWHRWHQVSIRYGGPVGSTFPVTLTGWFRQATVDGSEIPFPTTWDGCIKKNVNNGINYHINWWVTARFRTNHQQYVKQIGRYQPWSNWFMARL